MVEFDVCYQGPSAYQGGTSNMKSFANDLHDYMERNFDEESSIERVKIEGRGPDSRLIKITFPIDGEITTQHVELHCDTEEERLKRELLDLYEKSGFKLNQQQP